MSLRRLIVEVDVESLNVSAFCAEHGIGRSTFYELRRSYAAEGDAALESKSRAPRTVANRTPLEIENEIIRKRKELDDDGMDAGAESIHMELLGLEGLPTPSTIARILRRRGFVKPDPSKAPKHAHKTFRAERANECWQLDDTGWSLADGTEVKILNVVDDHSRLLVASAATLHCTGAFALTVLAAAAVVLGWPARFLSDNAKAFRHVLADALRPMGITAGHGRPYHPQTQGKVERFHQTLQRWLSKQPPAETIEQLQAQLDAFRHRYNHQRGHSSIGKRTPANVWEAAPKSGPSTQPLNEPTSFYKGIINGGVLWAGTRWQISIGAKHNGSAAIAIITGLACHIFIDGKLARGFTLDPTRRSQPLYHRKGRPPTVR